MMTTKILNLIGLASIVTLASISDCSAQNTEEDCKKICEPKFNNCATGDGIEDREQCIKKVVRSVEDWPEYNNCKDLKVCQLEAGLKTLEQAKGSQTGGAANTQ